MWKQINSELYRNENGHAIIVKTNKDNKQEVWFVDDNNPTLAIPIIDFLENPIYKYTSAWKELKSFIDSLRSDITNLFENNSALFINIAATINTPIYFPVNLSGSVATSNYPISTGRCHGIAYQNIALDNPGKIQCTGVIRNPSWNFTPNRNIFLNGSNLSHTFPANGFLQKIGTAKDSTTLVLDIRDPIGL